jgi:hypothetical protein
MGVKLLNLDELLDAVPERTSDDLATLRAVVYLDNKDVTFEFTELDSREWARCTLANPPRDDVEIDIGFGYNVTAATEMAAKVNGRVVDGDESAVVTASQWAKLFAPGRLDAQGRQSITDAVFSLNESHQLARIVSVKKAFEGKSKRKPRSPAN